MNDDDRMTEEQQEEKRFRILVCIDGSDESYQSLRYAAKMGRGVDADIVLVYVRAVDQGLRSGGFQVRVARENMLNWGLELPGIKYLKKGRDLLMDLGDMSADWTERNVHTDVEGDPLGDNKTEYTNKQGKKIVLKIKVAHDIATGILDQWEIGRYDLIILAASGRKRSLAKAWLDPSVAEKVAANAPCSVIVARDLEIGHGHLICTDGSERSMDTIRKDAVLASRCECPISLLSVAVDVESEHEAKAHVERAAAMLEEMGIPVEDTFTRVGNPVDEIIELGPDFSLIVVSDTEKSGLKRLFVESVSYKVLHDALNSVMIVK